MDYSTLLDLSAELGYRLAMSGAETFRVEESITRMLAAYGLPCEVFAIPNCLHVSIEKPDGTPMTRMRRIGTHGNNLEAVEKYNNLSRLICSTTPEPAKIQELLDETKQSCRQYNFLIYSVGHFLGPAGFAILFGGTLIDALWAGLCGILIGLANHWLNKKNVNSFFTTIATAFIMAFTAYGAGALGATRNTDSVIIGAIMLLVPGLLFTNAMRDIIYGDTNSGVNRIMQVLLIAIAIASGTGVAWSIATHLWGAPVSAAMLNHALFIQCLACGVGAVGFCFLFNIHGLGIVFCTAGGIMTWIVHSVSMTLGLDEMTAVLVASIFAAVYAEIMARRRKCPAIGYLIIGLISLIPGSSLYYTINHVLKSEMSQFADRGMKTIAIAGLMAAGILLVSTSVRMFYEGKKHLLTRKKLP